MALGRSNSLSINTGAVNNSFSQQQNQQPSTSGGLFGGSIFGNAQKPAATAPTTSLFGQPATTTVASTGGLFGAAAPAQPAPAGGLFGAATTQPAPSGGLFGASAAKPAGTSLFGGTTTTQPAQLGGLFGASTTNNNNLFGNQTKPATGGSHFGGSLFGAASNTAQPAAGGLFGASTASALQNAQQQQPSLLSASRYNLGQPAPFTGRLTMGQGNAQQSSSTPATKIDWDNVKPVTRFADLVDPAKATLEKIDEMIKVQEGFCKQIEAILPSHGQNLDSLQPDIDLIKEKCITAEQALISDAQGIQQSKVVTQKDNQDLLRCERIGENLRLPAQYHYAPAASAYGARKTGSNDAGLEEGYDVNLVNNYFAPMAAEMQVLLEAYSSNLQEIESHLSTVEATATAQAQSIAGQRSGNGNDSVRQLADTLRGFEATILATAEKVGAARESVTKLSIGNTY